MPASQPRAPRAPIVEFLWPGLDWTTAPAGFDWLAQDADGKWFWYSVEPQCNPSGGVWRSNSRQQQYAGSSPDAENWENSLQTHPTRKQDK